MCYAAVGNDYKSISIFKMEIVTFYLCTYYRDQRWQVWKTRLLVHCGSSINDNYYQCFSTSEIVLTDYQNRIIYKCL